MTQLNPSMTHCCHSPGDHVRLNRSWRSVIPSLLLAFIVTTLVVWLSQNFGLFGADLQVQMGSITFNITLPVFLLFCLVFIARPVLLLFDCHHEIKCHHLLSINGIFSLNKEQVEIPFEDIMGVRISQNLLERVLDVGNILVWTAVADRPEISMHGIGGPQAYAKAIQSKIDQALIARKSKHATSS